MPYVPSEKSDPPAPDRQIIDAAVEKLARHIASKIDDNESLRVEYKTAFVEVANALKDLATDRNLSYPLRLTDKLACAMHEAGRPYGYEGAFLGELNYGITRLIQRVPQKLVELGKWKEKDELRYWMYARTVSALVYASRHTEDLGLGIDGVFIDIKDEYKRRVNTAYEAAQILKNGDCYDTPYYTKLVEVVDEAGNMIGHQEVMLKHDKNTVGQDLLGYQIVVRKKSDSGS